MSGLKDLIPFAEMRRGVMKEYQHAMFSVGGMLRVTKAGANSTTARDMEGLFGSLIEEPTPELVEMVKSNAATTADAAALVFMHSAYDNAVFDLLGRLVKYDPDLWLPHVEKKSVELGVVLKKGGEGVRDDALDKWLAEAERKSFPWKVKTVLTALGALDPASRKDVVPGFEFNTDEFEKIDQLRHDVTHRPSFATPINDIYGKLRYLHCTMLMLERLAEKRYPGPAKK